MASVFIISDKDSTVQNLLRTLNNFEIIGSNIDVKKAIDELNYKKTDIIISGLPEISNKESFEIALITGAKLDFIKITNIEAALMNAIDKDVMFFVLKKKIRKFDELTAYVINHFEKKLSLESLGEMFRLNPTYICNLFKKEYQTTYKRFIITIRMKEAERLITQTNAALKEVSVMCGYTDYNHFCKLFKLTHNVTPTQFRVEQSLLILKNQQSDN